MKLVFHLSTKCNLNCTYCYQKNKKSSIMSFDTAKAFLDDLFLFDKEDSGKIFKYLIIDKQWKSQQLELDFFGGECLLHIDLIEQICNYFEQLCTKNNKSDWFNNYLISLNTNGVLINTKKVLDFYTKYKLHIKTSLSIDGCKVCHDMCRIFADGKGSYDAAETGVKKHIEMYKKAPRTKLTFSLENMSFIAENLKNLIALGYENIESSFDVLTFLTKEQSDQYYKYLCQGIDYIINNKIKLSWNLLWDDSFSYPQHKLGVCGHDGSIITINWEGKIYGCQQLSESFVGKAKEICLGTVSSGISNLGKQYIDYFLHKQFFSLNHICSVCPLLTTCAICPAVNLITNKSMVVAKPNCGVTIAENKARLYFAKCAKETNYPYLKNEVENILTYIKYDSEKQYLINN